MQTVRGEHEARQSRIHTKQLWADERRHMMFEDIRVRAVGDGCIQGYRMVVDACMHECVHVRIPSSTRAGSSKSLCGQYGKALHICSTSLP